MIAWNSVLAGELLGEAVDPRARGVLDVDYVQALIERSRVDGYRKVIDIWADSANSWGGIPIAEARRTALSAEIVINGLAILCRASQCSGRPNAYDLEAAFAETIIGGPASFVIRADGGSRFAEAVRGSSCSRSRARPVRIPRASASPAVRSDSTGQLRTERRRELRVVVQRTAVTVLPATVRAGSAAGGHRTPRPASPPGDLLVPPAGNGLERP